MPAGRRCPGERCPVVLTGGERYCPKHAREYELRRGTSTQRGYGYRHQKARRSWQARIDAGEIIRCSLCGLRVTGTNWHLDHTPDRMAYRGPAHVACNTSDGGRRGAAASNAKVD